MPRDTRDLHPGKLSALAGEGSDLLFLLALRQRLPVTTQANVNPRQSGALVGLRPNMAVLTGHPVGKVNRMVVADRLGRVAARKYLPKQEEPQGEKRSKTK